MPRPSESRAACSGGTHDPLSRAGRPIPSAHGVLPFPARRLTLSEINADYRKYLGELERGGAILVVSDAEQAFLGVLTRAPAVLGDAHLAQLIETWAVPPLERLLDAPTDAPAA